MEPASPIVSTCAICGKELDLQTCKIDYRGLACHSDCLSKKLLESARGGEKWPPDNS
jgi:hypothetical protein